MFGYLVRWRETRASKASRCNQVDCWKVKTQR